MPEPNNNEVFNSVEDFEKNYTPTGGLGALIDYYTKEPESSTEEKENEPENGDNSAGSGSSQKEEEKTEKKTEEIEEEFKGKSVSELIGLIKETRTTADEHKTKYENTEKELNTLKETGTGLTPDVKDFIESLRKDPFEAWKKHSEKLNLPALDLFKTVVNTNGDVKSRLKVYQENVLKPLIEEKFQKDKGTFRFDADEAENPDSPSYEYRRLSREKEQELETEVSSAVAKVKASETKAKERQAEDKKWYADTYLGGDAKKADEAVKAAFAIPEKIVKGELPPHKHPFSLRTILLGINHDDIVKQALEKREQEILDAFAKKGFRLKSDDFPENLKNIKKSQASDEGKRPAKTGIPALDIMNANL